MGRVEVSAPGKLVLLGEYAVLFGAPAIVAAMDRRAVVEVQECAVEAWEVKAPGLVPMPAAFDLAAGGSVRWHDEKVGRRHFGLVERLIQGMATAGLLGDRELIPFSATLDTRAFFDAGDGGRAKIGLGSSAALTAALASALSVWSGEEWANGASDDVLRRLVDLHHGIQGGRGSGIDVAASLLGGIVRYRLAGDGSIAEAKPVCLPGDLRMIYAWTGRSASTGAFLEKLESGLEQRPRQVRPAIDSLGSVSSDGAAAVAGGDAGRFLAAVDDFWEGLDRLGDAMKMPVLSDEHRQLRNIAETCGVTYKPSGAGGGDLGVGFAIDSDAVEEMARRSEAEGFKALDLQIDSRGLSVPGR